VGPLPVRGALNTADRAANLEAAIARNRAARPEAGSPDTKVGNPDRGASTDDERN
jgi:hypothetical protein